MKKQFSNTLGHRMMSECIGTFIIVLFGCGSMRAAAHLPPLVDPSFIPLVFGLAVMIAVYSLGHISGAHFNPAVTLAFTVSRHFPLKDVLGYWLAQFAGAIAASALLSLLVVQSGSFGETVLSVNVESGLLWEIVLSFVLMFVIISVATDTRAVGTMAGIAIGSTVAICAYLGGPFTTASMNPARSLGPAIMSGEFRSLWIYFAGPIIGAILAILLYEWIRGKQIDTLSPKS